MCENNFVLPNYHLGMLQDHYTHFRPRVNTFLLRTWYSTIEIGITYGFPISPLTFRHGTITKVFTVCLPTWTLWTMLSWEQTWILVSMVTPPLMVLASSTSLWTRLALQCWMIIRKSAIFYCSNLCQLIRVIFIVE